MLMLLTNKTRVKIDFILVGTRCPLQGVLQVRKRQFIEKLSQIRILELEGQKLPC